MTETATPLLARPARVDRLRADLALIDYRIEVDDELDRERFGD